MSVQILLGDVFARLEELPDNSVDCIITSPPYWGLRDYGVEGQLGMEPTLGEHIEMMVRVFRELRRVLKPEGVVFLNYGDCYATTPNGRAAADVKALKSDDRAFQDKPFSTIQGSLKRKDLCMVPNRLAIALQDDGWWVRSEIIWAKPNPMPDSAGRYRPSTAHEKIFMLTKSANSYYDAEAVRMPSAASSIDRLSQDIESQGGSNRANGGRKSNGPMKAFRGRSTYGRHTLGDAIPAKKRGARLEHAGFRDKWDNMTKSEQEANGRLLRNYEPDLSPIVPPEVWNIATAPFKEAHFATFPPALVAPCIMAGCPEGGLILDPFGGAGTTGLVADRMRRDAILIELNEEYAELAQRRINEEQPMFPAANIVKEAAYQSPPGWDSWGNETEKFDV
jgi:DNA modification methylase